MYSNLELYQITDNKRFWKTIKPFLSGKCFYSSSSPLVTLVNNKAIISNGFKLAQTLNIYFESTVGKLRTKECEANFDLNANFRSKNGVDVAIEKYKDHPNIK